MPSIWLEARAELEDRRAMLSALLALEDLGAELDDVRGRSVGEATDDDDAITLVDGATVDLEPPTSGEALEMRAVERALARIEEGTFGACELCACEIELGRLSCIPWSRCCAACVTFSERELRAVTEDATHCAECAAAHQQPATQELRRAA